MKQIIQCLITMAALIVATSCVKPKTTDDCKQFVVEILHPCDLSVGDYSEAVYPYDKTTQKAPQRFKCRLVDGKIQNVDNLVITGFMSLTEPVISEELKDVGYYRVWPLFHGNKYESIYDMASKEERFSKYYIPDRPLYWNFEEITIVSDNASFGSEYPVGSDLTPIVTFGFPSLLEFIQNDYKGPYTKEHLIRANDKEAWSNMPLFESGHPKLIIDRPPTEVQGEGLPSITIRIKFTDRGIELVRARLLAKDPNKELSDLYEPQRDMSITLLLDIQK